MSQSKPAPAGKVYATPALYKDYNKATADFLTKNIPKANTWKIESKFKGPKDTFYVNPSATSDGKLACDIEYAPSSCGASVKVTVTPECCSNLKTTVAYNVGGHKVEAVLHKKGGNELDYEVSHETAVIAGKRMSLNEKVTKRDVTLGLGVDVAPNCQIGCGAVYDMKANVCKWSVGCRYYRSGVEVAVHTRKLQEYISSASFPIYAKINGRQSKMNIAAETICGKGKTLEAAVGFEAACPVYPSNIVKARVNRNMEWAVAYIAKLADNWTVAVSLNKDLKAGVLLSHS